MYIALAQINPVVGDLHYNTEKILTYTEKAKSAGAELVVFPELTLTGYPPRDLLFCNKFLDAVEAGVEKLLPASRDIGILIGAPCRDAGKLYNAALLLHGGKVTGKQYKSLIPFYDVFDEQRYFTPARERNCIDFKGIKLGVTVCEDIWNDKDYWNQRRYDLDPVEEQVQKGAQLIVNLSASPYSYGKHRLRCDMLGKAAAKHGVGIIYVNQVGGNDHLLFDGSSCAVTRNGTVCLQLENFAEDFAFIDTRTLQEKTSDSCSVEDISWIYKALVIGTRDYLHKNGFHRAAVGLSGGIDSSITAAVAADALGPDNVIGVSMPSRYSSQGSKNDARDLARNLGIEYRVVPIENMFNAYVQVLNPDGTPLVDLAEENVQARIRGNILMYISNREGPMVLATGNKSEMAMGYSTLYGDMSGGLAVLADVPKVIVYELAEYINREREIIPRSVITKPPSAELRPGQKDEDSLPPYEILDAILKAYIEEIKSIDEIVSLGYDRDLVVDIARRVDRAEYKRQQAPPGLRVTSRAFGPGRRMPIAHRWHLE
ncbi:NAD+ synthase [Desulfoscipio geothermicus]|uniref:Glutamine-dependent NAD(+) synthetase n=1 Tax=Desulfoscipio geothermicus DSM 3669 TaxID=1121426 RepID=A0A1I6CPM3_9FIRM|nr:NAD+ synthase [Desulfoscipio geothermicus]SFQ95126.1 NAD+ synthase (glutamine-hydrolysing) [Desulfoscipio geothermicus DSM 3669]